MAKLTPLFLLSLLLLLLLVPFNVMAQAKVQTFTYVNHGEIGPYTTEYGANYRDLPLSTSPFQLCFYNTTPNAFYLALRMGTLLRPRAVFHWVWEANRGRPVRENATFSLLPDGNLVLADADRRVVWSTGTTNYGVAGLKLLPSGNMILYDSRGRYLWQSFDFPTDTLLVGQSYRIGGTTKLVSRGSDGSFGIYSLAMEAGRLSLYINNITDQPLPYLFVFNAGSSVLESVGLLCDTEGTVFYLNLRVVDLSGSSNSIIVGRRKYNATLSFLRLEMDGNLVVYTYNPVGYGDDEWEETFPYFSRGRGRCGLPSKCGELGICEEDMCVACPTTKGLLGWNKGCRLPKLGACRGRAAVDYYKVVGVENFLTGYVKGEADIKVEDCKRRCNTDCGCKGFMYWEESSTCWLAPVLGTLAKVSNSPHLAYIKYTK